MTIALLGSSSVESSTAPLARELARRWGDVTPLGRRGWSVGSWLRVQVLPLELRDVSAVVVYLPGNAAATSAQIRELHERIAGSTSAPVRWALPPEWPAWSEGAALARGLADAMRSARVPLLSEARVQLERADLAADGVHLTARGAGRVAASWPMPPRAALDASPGSSSSSDKPASSVSGRGGSVVAFAIGVGLAWLLSKLGAV